MAKESVKILRGKIDVDNLLSQLNAALSEEWLAYYQYWVGAQVVEGILRPGVQSELEEHAEEEKHHADLIAKRIIELEGVPVLDPMKWFELARCKYLAPTDFDTINILHQNIASERCAIMRYQEIANYTNGIDFTTCDMAKHILAEEEDHEQDRHHQTGQTCFQTLFNVLHTQGWADGTFFNNLNRRNQRTGT